MRPSPRMQPLRTTSVLIALAALLLAANPTTANNDEAIFAAARNAVVKKRTEQSKVLGFHDTRRTFTEIPEEGAVLIGFDLGVGKFFDIDSIYAVRPIYRAVFGETVGSEYGLFRDRIKPNNKGTIKSKVVRTVRIRARDGYAVGGMTLRSGLNINGLSLTYMKIDGRTLDPIQSYRSEWVGDRTGGGEATVDGKGAPVIGIAGSQSEEHAHALALVFIRDGAPAAPAPVLPPVAPPPPPPKQEEPPVLPPDVLKRLQPVQQPREEPAKEPEDEPPAKEPEPIPPAPASRADAPAKGTNWLPYLIFGAVTLPVFLLLAFSFTRRSQIADHRRGKPKRSADRSPTPRPPGKSTGIREGPGAKRPSRSDDDGFIDDLTALLDPPRKVEEESVKREGLEVSLQEFQMPRPWWVRVGLWQIHDRTTARAFFWMSLLMGVLGAAGAIWEPWLLLCLGFVPAALWYLACIRWVDKHDHWV